MRLRSALPPRPPPRVALSSSLETLNATQPGRDRPSRVRLRRHRQSLNHRRPRARRSHANHRARARPRSSNHGCPHGRRLASPTPTSAYRPGLLRAEVRREGRRGRSRAIRRRAPAHVPRPAYFCRRRPSSFSSSFHIFFTSVCLVFQKKTGKFNLAVSRGAKAPPPPPRKRRRGWRETSWCDAADGDDDEDNARVRKGKCA